MVMFEQWFWQDELDKIKCAECGKRLSKPGSTGPTAASDDQLKGSADAMPSRAVYCEGCRVSYCEECTSEAGRKIGKTNLICPQCGRDLGNA